MSNLLSLKNPDVTPPKPTMSNEASPKCPQCGTPIKADAPAGLCPNCLMVLNLNTETVLTGDTSNPEPPLPPEKLAPYFAQLEILECLGRGGMGVVYKARQKSLNRLVALKLLAPERVTDAKFAERFTREAHALAALNHPHIVTVYDFGQAGGYYFLLMEFVDGVNLRQLLQAKKLTPEEALAVIPPLCDALQYAHEQGVVHRDIKPENLLLDKGGRVKIADFGIAKMVGEDSSVGLAESQPAGTPQYMAPEQKDYQRTDHRADIYSLGVVLYEMLTGELPAEKLQAPSRKVQIDVRLDAIVLRALEKTPELRYPTAVEFRTQVETLVAETSRSEPDLRTREGETADGIHDLAKETVASYLRMAILGACWAPLLFASLFLIKWYHGTSSLTSWWGVLIVVTLGVLGLTAPIGTTILGWTAVARMRRSAGRMRGLVLAVFDGLFFPLLMLDGLLGWMAFTAWRLCVDFFANPAMQIDPAFGTRLANRIAHHQEIPNLVALVVALTLDFYIIRRVWRVVSGALPTGSAPKVGFVRKVVLGAGGVTLLLMGLLVFLTLISWRSSRLTGAHRSAEALEQQFKQQQGKMDASPAGNREDEIIQLARSRLEQTRQLYKAKHVSLSVVEEAEGELALAEARGDWVKRAEIRLAMATKHLQRSEELHRTRIISDEEFNRAKQRRLEAELELQRATVRPAPEKPFNALQSSPESQAASNDAGASVITRSFPLRHRLASQMADDLRQILHGQSGHEAKSSADNQELLVTAPPEVMMRVQTFITVNDWPDAITRGSDFQSRNNSVTRAARSFFYACAVEDSAEVFSKQLSLGVLAKLKGDTKSKEFEGYQWGRAEVDPNWEKSLRADWPGKKEAIQRLIREWNRYPLKRLIEDPGVTIGFGVKHSCSVSFEGAPKPFYQVTIEPDRTKPRGEDNPSYFFSSLPPWWDGDSTKPSDSAALDLSYQQFDQTYHSGWRVLAQDEKGFREAAALIEAYLLHDNLNNSERVNLHFHAAQCLAFAGDAKSVLDALGHLKQAHYVNEPPDIPLRWNDYVSANEAFLKGDLDALKAARERIAAGPKLNGVPANLDVVDRLIARFGKPYRNAYSTETEEAGRTNEALGK
jgi:tRNA A-37 threonylcarbamoyl transferase component Bud32